MLQPNVPRYEGTNLWNIGDILCLKYRLFPVISKYDVIIMQPTMLHKEYLNLLVSEVVSQSSPQQTEPLRGPLLALSSFHSSLPPLIG